MVLCCGSATSMLVWCGERVSRLVGSRCRAALFVGSSGLSPHLIMCYVCGFICWLVVVFVLGWSKLCAFVCRSRGSRISQCIFAVVSWGIIFSHQVIIGFWLKFYFGPVGGRKWVDGWVMVVYCKFTRAVGLPWARPHPCPCPQLLGCPLACHRYCPPPLVLSWCVRLW